MTDLEKTISYFKEISKIPRATGDEKAISDYLAAFARERNLEVIQDENNNIIIKKPAFPGEEHRETLIFQGHMDMVYVKTEDSKHRYEDGIEVLDDGEFLYTKDTTLGADNGIALCYSLMLLDSKEIKHPAMEFIFTVDEEIGMKGAATIDLSGLKGKTLLNLDSEEEGIFCVGCAGGFANQFKLPVEREEKNKKLVPVELAIVGLKGGHSGIEIQLERGNAIKILGRVLCAMKDLDFSIGMVDAPGKTNLISQRAKMVCYVTEAEKDAVVARLEEMEGVFQNELQFSDTIKFQITVKDAVDNCSVYTEATKEKLTNLLTLIPSGVVSMSMGVKDLVQTSTNVGVMTEEDGKITFASLVRSSVGSQKEIVRNQLQALADIFGGESICEHDYPGWEYKKDSRLRDVAVREYERLSGKKAVIQAVHAGLECGYFEGKIKNLDCISIGPDMSGVHTPNERVSIQSIGNVWELIKAVVEAF